LQQKEEENKKGKNSRFDDNFEDNKEEFTLFSDLKRSVISRFSATQN
jgi:hypothetical protein